MESFENVVTRLVSEVVEYTDLGFSKSDALIVVKKDTCASEKAWKEVSDRIMYCPQCMAELDTLKAKAELLDEMVKFIKVLDEIKCLWGIDDNYAIHAKVLINKAQELDKCDK